MPAGLLLSGCAMVKMLKSTLRSAPTRVQPAALTVSETKRTRGRAWMTRRSRIMRRDCGLCQHCKREGRLQLAEQVDHIRELADGGTDDENNLEALCSDCHKAKSARSAAARAGR